MGNLPLTIPLFYYRFANSLIPHLPIPNYLFREQIPKPRTPQISLRKGLDMSLSDCHS